MGHDAVCAAAVGDDLDVGGQLVEPVGELTQWTVPFTATATDANPASPVVTCTRAPGQLLQHRHHRSHLLGDRRGRQHRHRELRRDGEGVGPQLTDLQAKVQNLPPTLDATSRKNLVSILQTAHGGEQGRCSRSLRQVDLVRQPGAAQSGRKITTLAADSLVMDARRIMAVLGCS